MPGNINGADAVNGSANGTNGLSTHTPSHPAFDSIPDVIKAVANDEFVIVLDSPSRENEGDLIIAASALTPSKASFMIRYSSGYICAPLPASRAAALHLPQMVADSADPNSTSTNFRRPGHVLPLQARDGGVRVRRGHTEAAVDLCRLAGKPEVGVICELILDGAEVEGKAEFLGGGMMRRDDCLAFGKKFGIKVCTIEDLVTYIEETEGKLGVKGTDY